MFVHKAKRALKNVVKKLVKCKKHWINACIWENITIVGKNNNKKKQKVQNK